MLKLKSPIAGALTALSIIAAPVAIHAAETNVPKEANTKPLDTDGDGKADAWDTNGDGKADAWDTNSDGKPDAWDTNGDGAPDKHDRNGDGKPDTSVR